MSGLDIQAKKGYTSTLIHYFQTSTSLSLSLSLSFSLSLSPFKESAFTIKRHESPWNANKCLFPFLHTDCLLKEHKKVICTSKWSLIRFDRLSINIVISLIIKWHILNIICVSKRSFWIDLIWLFKQHAAAFSFMSWIFVTLNYQMNINHSGLCLSNWPSG